MTGNLTISGIQTSDNLICTHNTIQYILHIKGIKDGCPCVVETRRTQIFCYVAQTSQYIFVCRGKTIHVSDGNKIRANVVVLYQSIIRIVMSHNFRNVQL